MNSPRILIAGIGNIFFGDDAFGVEVARRMAQRQLPEGVRVVDFGIRGLDLTYALLEDWEAVILVDALPRGGPVGTVYALEPEVDSTGMAGTAIEPHALNPVNVLRMARELGSTIERILLVGCEPGPGGSGDDMRMAMSQPVEAAVEEAITLIGSLVTQLMARDFAGDDYSSGQSPGRRSCTNSRLP
jgi:hydrogenase maturation protease